MERKDDQTNAISLLRRHVNGWAGRARDTLSSGYSHRRQALCEPSTVVALYPVRRLGSPSLHHGR